MTTSINNIKTYRHEFSKEFMAELSRFSKVHQYDDRHAYKSEWQKWINQETIAQAMDFEKRRLQENGYIGDIDDKMFKAGRYYFRKKTITTENIMTPKSIDSSSDSPIAARQDGQDLPANVTPTTPTATTATATTTTRRTYITMSKQCIRLMDDHISSAATATGTQFKPSTCYNDFYESQMTTFEMTKEIENIIEKYEKTPGAMANLTADELTVEIMDKIKKTYKNRYYKYISSSRNDDNNNNNIDADAAAD
jgi:Tfp pilus assembly protein PilW